MWIIYHNQDCSKSRAAFELLNSKGIEFRVVNYLDNPPSIDELTDICQKLNGDIESMVRKKEVDFIPFEASWNTWDLEQKIEFISQNIHLLERPILVNETTAKIGRPDHTVLFELFEEA